MPTMESPPPDEVPGPDTPPAAAEEAYSPSLVSFAMGGALASCLSMVFIGLLLCLESLSDSGQYPWQVAIVGAPLVAGGLAGVIYLRTRFSLRTLIFVSLALCFAMGIFRQYQEYRAGPRRLLGRNLAGVNSINFSADGRLLAAGDQAGVIRLYEVPSGNVTWEVTTQGNGVRRVALSPDGSRLVSVEENGALRLWHVNDPDPPRIIVMDGRPPPEIALSHDGRLLARHWPGQVIVLDLDTGDETTQECPPEIAVAIDLVFSPDDSRLAVAGSSGGGLAIQTTYRHPLTKVFMYRSAADDGPVSLFNDDRRGILNMDWASSGAIIATGCASGDVALHYLVGAGGRALMDVRDFHQYPRTRIQAVAFSPDGKLLVSTNPDNVNRICLWNVETRRLAFRLRGHRSEVTDLEFSPSGGVFASCSQDGDIWLWDAPPSLAPLLLTALFGGVTLVFLLLVTLRQRGEKETADPDPPAHQP